MRNTVLPRGGGADGLSPVFIPKGQRVDYTCYAMHRRKDLYGEDADAFRPERWGEGAGRGWEFLPFNGGPRICLGRMFSHLLVIVMAVGRLLTPSVNRAIRPDRSLLYHYKDLAKICKDRGC